VFFSFVSLSSQKEFQSTLVDKLAKDIHLCARTLTENDFRKDDKIFWELDVGIAVGWNGSTQLNAEVVSRVTTPSVCGRREDQLGCFGDVTSVHGETRF
jgi:hypothetical protein